MKNAQMVVSGTGKSGGNFYKQQLVFGKLSNTVNLSIFCFSFIHMLTILG